MPSIAVGNGNGGETKKRVDLLEEENLRLKEQLKELNVAVENEH